MTKKKILIATGGTGGHTYPALSLANYLANQNFNIKLTSDARGFKYLKNYKNLSLIKILSSPLIKRNIFMFLISSLIILFSIINSLIFLLISRPSIIFGMGGYASFPICIAASILRIKFIIYENNLIIGKANKFLLPYANKVFVSYKQLEGIPKKYQDKVVEIGNLIRKEIINSSVANNEIDNFNKINILVLGGSQAAQVFANDLPQIFVKLQNSDFKIKVYQQCLKSQTSYLSEFYKKYKIEHELFNFADNILDYYSNINLVITRSGASVLGELINLNIPFISVPLPTSTDNHQYKNAEFYSKKGYGYLLEESEINNKLYNIISSIFREKSLIKKIISNQKQYSDKNIFNNLNHQIKKILNEKN